MQRRHFLSAFSISAAGLAISRPAAALTLEPMPAHLRRAAPAANGALDWELLAEAGETQLRDGEISRFPAALRALDNSDVRLAGYMMPFRDGAQHSEFLLGGLQFHCVTCMTGDLTRLVAVRAARPVAYSDGPVLLRGRLTLLEDGASPLYYRLDQAEAA